VLLVVVLFVAAMGAELMEVMFVLVVVFVLLVFKSPIVVTLEVVVVFVTNV